jgi:hypothetical protein
MNVLYESYPHSMKFDGLAHPAWSSRDAFYHAAQAIIALQHSIKVALIHLEENCSWIDLQCEFPNESGFKQSIKARDEAKAIILVALAGPAAQLQYSFGQRPSGFSLPGFDLADRHMLSDDGVWRAISLAAKVSRDSPALIRTLWRRANKLIQADAIWSAIQAVASSLLDNGELAGAEIEEIVRHAIQKARKP